jgi:hypothetical protein
MIGALHAGGRVAACSQQGVRRPISWKIHVRHGLRRGFDASALAFRGWSVPAKFAQLIVNVAELLLEQTQLLMQGVGLKAICHIHRDFGQVRLAALRKQVSDVRIVVSQFVPQLALD